LQENAEVTTKYSKWHGRVWTWYGEQKTGDILQNMRILV